MLRALEIRGERRALESKGGRGDLQDLAELVEIVAVLGEHLVDAGERDRRAGLAARELDEVARARREHRRRDGLARDIGGAAGVERLGRRGDRHGRHDREDRNVGEQRDIARLADDVRGIGADDDEQARRTAVIEREPLGADRR